MRQKKVAKKRVKKIANVNGKLYSMRFGGNERGKEQSLEGKRRKENGER